MSNNEKQQKAASTAPNPTTTNGRYTPTSISLSNVLWILVMVISVASFFFTFDTRITLLEDKIKDVPVTADQVRDIHRSLNVVENRVEATKYRIQGLEEYQKLDTDEIKKINDRLEELLRDVRLLEAEVKHLKEAVRRYHSSQMSNLPTPPNQ